MGSLQAVKPVVGEGQVNSLPRALLGSRVHAHSRRAGWPLRNGCRRSGGASPEGHCRQSLVRWLRHHAFISLRPFAPPALPGFNATMDALTPVHHPYLEVASAASCLPWRPMLRRGLDGLGVVRPLPLVSSRRDCLSWTGLPVSFVASSVHSASNHPLPSRCVIWRFLPSGLPSPHRCRCCVSSRTMRLGLRHSLAGSPRQKAESSSRRLTPSQPLLRTGRSPPVASHPASRRRSYLQLQGTRPP